MDVVSLVVSCDLKVLHLQSERHVASTVENFAHDLPQYIERCVRLAYIPIKKDKKKKKQPKQKVGIAQHCL